MKTTLSSPCGRRRFHRFIQTGFCLLLTGLAAATLGAVPALLPYQGKVSVSGTPFTGTGQFKFSLVNANGSVTWWSNDGSGSSGSEPATAVSLPVNTGLYSLHLGDTNLAHMLALPPDVFTNDAVRLRVWFNDGSTGFQRLDPDQRVGAGAYAFWAGSVPASALGGAYPNVVTLSNAANVFAGSGAGLTGVDAATVGGVAAANLWKLGGNAGTTPGAHFLGTTDDRPLEFKVNGQRVLLLQPSLGGGASIVGGAAGNSVAAGAYSAVIAGGTGNTIGDASPVSVVGGGEDNDIHTDSIGATIGGGSQNAILTNSIGAVISGGVANYVFSDSMEATIAGGFQNAIRGNCSRSVIGGGTFNDVGSPSGTIAGGEVNTIGTNSPQATIGGGERNAISTNAPHSLIGGGQENSIGGHSGFATVAGGQQNSINLHSDAAFIGGGRYHLIGEESEAATIAGGSGNVLGVLTYGSAVGGGVGNRIDAQSNESVIAGGFQNWIDQFASGSAIGGGVQNKVGRESSHSTISGGSVNWIGTNSAWAMIGGGEANAVLDHSEYAVIPGGYGNSATNHAFAAGRRAKAIHKGSFVWADTQDADFASTSINQFNLRASGGVRLSDDTPAISFGSTTRQMLDLYGTHFGVGVQDYRLYFRTGPPGFGNGFEWFSGGQHSSTAGDPGAGGTTLMSLNSGGLTVNGTFVSASDRAVKRDFESVDSRAVLEKVAALPLNRWRYTNDADSVHLGPVAQDFHAAFGLGRDDKHIATVDADGVALAAIQGLNQRLTEELQRQDAENAGLKQELTDLRKLVEQLNTKLNGDHP